MARIDPDWERWVRWCNGEQHSSVSNTLVDSLHQLSRDSEFDRPIVAIDASTDTLEAAGYLVLYPGAFGVIGNWRCITRSKDIVARPSIELEIDVASSILEDLCRIALQAGAEVVQHIATIDPDQLGVGNSTSVFEANDPRQRTLQKSGMTAIAILVQMELWLEHNSASFCSEDNDKSGLEFHSWDGISRQQALQLIEQTYIGTLDVPELNGVRSTARTLEGYRGQAIDAENRWWAIQKDAKWIGCLILTDLSRIGTDRTWELTYIGLTPESRGQGLSRMILQFAVERTKEAGATRLTLAVDVRNSPALHLYRTSGFVPVQFVQAWVKSASARID